MIKYTSDQYLKALEILSTNEEFKYFIGYHRYHKILKTVMTDNRDLTMYNVGIKEFVQGILTDIENPVKAERQVRDNSDDIF